MPTAAIITAAFLREAEVQRAALGAVALEPVLITHPLSTLSDVDIQARAEEALPQIRTVLVAR